MLVLFFLLFFLSPILVFGQGDSPVFVPVDFKGPKLDQALLFDSKTWMGWRVQKDGPYGGGCFTIKEGAFCSDPAHPGLLLTTGQYSDFLLEFEMQAEDETDAFLLLRTSPNPKNLATSCYAIVLSVSSAHPERYPCSIWGRSMLQLGFDDFDKKNADGTPPWKRFHVYVREKVVRVNCGAFLKNECIDEASVRRGYIGFLVTKGKARFRNIEWSPAQSLPLFSEDNYRLNFWKKSEDTAYFSVQSDQTELSLIGGPGMLETQASFDNFILQTVFRTINTESRGDVFFRCLPGEMSTGFAGYRCSINNHPSESGTVKTLGERTGSLVSLKEARNVETRDDQWNSLIVKAVDNHFQTWVNGIQTVDYTDKRPEENTENSQEGLRLQEGTIQMHGRSPGSALKFKSIEVAPVSKRWISREEERLLNEQRARELLPPRPTSDIYELRP